jgi:hypothetical protein
VLIAYIHQHEGCVDEWRGDVAVHLHQVLVGAIEVIQQYLLGTFSVHFEQTVLLGEVRLNAALLLDSF